MINWLIKKEARMKTKMFFVLLLFIFSTVLFCYNGFWYLKGLSLSRSLPEIEFENHSTLVQLNEDYVIKKNTPLYPKRPTIGEHYAELIIPKLNEKLPIYYGVESEQLKKGVGQVIRTALPGEGNNTILSGHRDTVFRNLGDLKIDDLLIAKTPAGEFKYKITKIDIVDKEDRTVISPKPKDTLTLITCYPFRFIGSAPMRYVISAELVQNHKRLRLK